MSIKVSIENYGTFFIKQSKIVELLSWLQQNQDPNLGELTNRFVEGQLINE